MYSHQLFRQGFTVYILTSNVDAQPVLLGLQEAAEDGNLHVQRHLGVHEGLVLVELVGQLVQQPLDLVLLGSQLNTSNWLLALI